MTRRRPPFFGYTLPRKRPHRVEVIHRVLVEEQGYAESPTMAANMWPIAEKIASAIRVNERTDRD